MAARASKDHVAIRSYGNYTALSKMAALNLEAQSPEHQPMPGAVTTRRLEGTLVTPRVSKPVPNHIADTSKCLLVACMFEYTVVLLHTQLLHNLYMHVYMHLQKSLAAPREMVFSRQSLASSILMAIRSGKSISKLW